MVSSISHLLEKFRFWCLTLKSTFFFTTIQNHLKSQIYDFSSYHPPYLSSSSNPNALSSAKVFLQWKTSPPILVGSWVPNARIDSEAESRDSHWNGWNNWCKWGTEPRHHTDLEKTGMSPTPQKVPKSRSTENHSTYLSDKGTLKGSAWLPVSQLFLGI